MITPCGIANKPVGSVQTALGTALSHSPGSSSSSSSSVSSDGSSSAASIPQLQLDSIVQDPLITEYRYALLEALEEVFGLQLQQASREQVQQLLAHDATNSSSSSAVVQVVGRPAGDFGPVVQPATVV